MNIYSHLPSYSAGSLGWKWEIYPDSDGCSIICCAVFFSYGFQNSLSFPLTFGNCNIIYLEKNYWFI